jgi:hypothetical protein
LTAKQIFARAIENDISPHFPNDSKKQHDLLPLRLLVISRPAGVFFKTGCIPDFFTNKVKQPVNAALIRLRPRVKRESYAEFVRVIAAFPE